MTAKTFKCYVAQVKRPSVCYATPMYTRCRCNLDGKVNGKKCRDCGGFGVLLEELPPRPPREPQQLALL